MIAFAPVDPVEDILARLAFFRRSHFSRGSEVGVTSDFEADLCEWFGFNPSHSRIVAALYAASGPVSRDDLTRRARVSTTTLKLDLPCIRQALGVGAIPPSDDGRYQLTQLGRAACDEAVANVGIGYLRGRLVA
jgi:hypothetical protein